MATDAHDERSRRRNAIGKWHELGTTEHSAPPSTDCQVPTVQQNRRPIRLPSPQHRLGSAWPAVLKRHWVALLHSTQSAPAWRRGDDSPSIHHMCCLAATPTTVLGFLRSRLRLWLSIPSPAARNRIARFLVGAVPNSFGPHRSGRRGQPRRLGAISSTKTGRSAVARSARSPLLYAGRHRLHRQRRCPGTIVPVTRLPTSKSTQTGTVTNRTVGHSPLRRLAIPVSNALTVGKP